MIVTILFQSNESFLVYYVHFDTAFLCNLHKKPLIRVVYVKKIANTIFRNICHFKAVMWQCETVQTAKAPQAGAKRDRPFWLSKKANRQNPLALHFFIKLFSLLCMENGISCFRYRFHFLDLPHERSCRFRCTLQRGLLLRWSWCRR